MRMPLLFLLAALPFLPGMAGTALLSDRVEISGQFGKILLDRRSGAIRRVVAGDRELTLRSSCLWSAGFDDGRTVDSGEAKTVCTIEKEQVRFVSDHPLIDVVVTVAPHPDYVDFQAEVSVKEHNLKTFALPGKLEFSPDAVDGVVCQIPRPNNVGAIFNRNFFLPASRSGVRVWKFERTTGPSPYMKLFGSPAGNLGHAEFETLEFTPEAEQMLGKKLIDEVKSFRTMPVRPFGKGQADIVLARHGDDVIWGGARLGGKGALFRMGGFNYHWGSIPAYLKMTDALLRHLLAQSARKKIGVLCFPYGIEQGLSPSAAQWRELLKQLPGEYVELTTSAEILHAVGSRDFAVIFNPYGELCPAPGSLSLTDFVEEIGRFVRNGGYWFETDGYSFYSELREQRFLTSGKRSAPNGMADFFHLGLCGRNLAVYCVQPLDYPPFACRKDSGKIFIPTLYEFGGEERGGFLEREYLTFIPPGKTWRSPVTRFRFGALPLAALEAFAADNGVTRPLNEKLPPDLLRKLVRSVLICQRGKTARKMISQLSEFPSPALIHTASYLKGGFDRQYPDHLPPRPQWGTPEELHAYLDAIRQRGMLFMPYTNNTWWCDKPKGPTFEKVGDVPLQRDVSGKLFREVYGAAQGYAVTMFHPAVREANERILRQFTEEYPSDLIFQDQSGGRGALFGGRLTGLDFNPASPMPYAKIEGIASTVRSDAQKAPLATEEIWWGLLNSEVMVCGLSFGLIPFNPYQVLLKEIYPPATWNLFPMLQGLAGDKVILAHHNLGASVRSRAEISWTLALGYAMVRQLDGVRFTPQDREELRWIDRLQKSVCSRYAGRKVTAFSHDWGTPAGREDDGIIRTVYGPVSVVANLTGSELPEPGYRIPPHGFLASADGMLAGSDFVREEGKLYLFASPGSSVAVPGIFGKRCRLVDGTALEVRDGRVFLPEGRPERFPLLWEAEIQ